MEKTILAAVLSVWFLTLPISANSENLPTYIGSWSVAFSSERTEDYAAWAYTTYGAAWNFPTLEEADAAAIKACEEERPRNGRTDICRDIGSMFRHRCFVVYRMERDLLGLRQYGVFSASKMEYINKHLSKVSWRDGRKIPVLTKCMEWSKRKR